MKKLVSIFILCGIFLSSFFAQEANASVWRSLVTVNASSHSSSNQNYHKRLIFSEVSNETEDSEERSTHEIQWVDYKNIISENKYIKNTLNTFIFNPISKFNIKNAFPIFLKNRSILI